MGDLAPTGARPERRRPRVSVVVPALNEEACLASCLTSLAAQDYDGEIEVIVADNGSTDATCDIARAHGAVVVVETRRGVCWARQAGTAVAGGDVVISTDADTTFDARWVRRSVQRFADRPELVAVAGGCEFVAAPWWGKVYAMVLFGTVSALYGLTGRVLYASATNIAFRRSAWTGYDTHMTQGGDELGFLRRLRDAGPVAFALDNPTYTSSRRLRRGLLYNVVVTCIYHYLVAYSVNRLAGRRVLGNAPEIREKTPNRPTRGRLGVQVSSAAVGVAVVVLAVRLGAV